jgi:hypothetical protein
MLQDIIALVIQGVGGGMASSADDLAGANVVRDLYGPRPRRSLIFVGCARHAWWNCVSIWCAPFVSPYLNLILGY